MFFDSNARSLYNRIVQFKRNAHEWSNVMNTASPTTVDIKKTLLHYIKAEFKEKDLDMLKSLLGSIYT